MHKLYDEDRLPEDQPPILTSNVKDLLTFVYLLTDSDRLYSTIGVVTAWAGEGKTIAALVCQKEIESRFQSILPMTIRVKVMPRSTSKTLAKDVMEELGEQARGDNSSQLALDAALSIERNNLRLLIFDEADRLNDDSFEVVRYLLDKAGCPILLKRNANLYNLRVTLGVRRAISAISRLLSALESKPVMYCEHQSFQVLSVDLARTSLGSVTTWADLLAPSCQPDLRLRFLTPTIFIGTTEGGETIEQFPQPHCVFSGLQKQWIQLDGPELADEFSTWLQHRCCFVSDYRLQAKPIAVRTETGSLDFYTGWKGWITYSTRQPHVGCMSTLRALARMACFTGTGTYTEIGLGVTLIDEKRGYVNAMACDQDGF